MGDYHADAEIRARDQIMGALMDRIAAMAKLLDSVPHFHAGYNPEDRMDIKNGLRGQCESDCPACAWAEMKKDGIG